jgi:catechol 2,3-dioxygenase-like lactoylglutathione lyase family enzyme
MVVSDLWQACDWFERNLGLKARDYRSNQGRGMQLDARILLGNECWLHLVQNWNPESRVNQFLHSHGAGLEHIALETDSIEADVQHLRDLGIPIFDDRILNANDGFEAFVYPDQTECMTVELIQPHATSWNYPDPASEPVSSVLRVRKLDHVGLAVRDIAATCARFERFFGVKASRTDSGPRIDLPNGCWLALRDGSVPDVSAFLTTYGPGLDHIALETEDLSTDRRQLGSIAEISGASAAHLGNRAGASVPPDEAVATSVELVQRS